MENGDIDSFFFHSYHEDCMISCVFVSVHAQLFAYPWNVASVHGILQARILEWVAVPSSRDPPDPRD